MIKSIITLLLVVSFSLATTVILETTQGNIKLKLLDTLAPKTVENFIGLINQNFYNGIIFHRIMKRFMIQSGDPTGTGRGGKSIWNKAFKDENFNTPFDRAGILAMANRGPNTNTSQFFITTIPTPWLNKKHTIFGYVANKESLEVVSRLENVEVDGRNKPKQTQEIIKAYIVE